MQLVTWISLELYFLLLLKSTSILEEQIDHFAEQQLGLPVHHLNCYSVEPYLATTNNNKNTLSKPRKTFLSVFPLIIPFTIHTKTTRRSLLLGTDQASKTPGQLKRCSPECQSLKSQLRGKGCSTNSISTWTWVFQKRHAGADYAFTSHLFDISIVLSSLRQKWAIIPIQANHIKIFNTSIKHNEN